MSKIGIYAPNAQGHRFKYVQYIVSSIVEMGHEAVLLTTAEALQSPTYDLHLAPLAHRFSYHIVDLSGTKDLAFHARALDTTLMVNPEGDAFVWKEAWHRGWRGPGTVSALVMRPTSQSNRTFFRFMGTLAKRALMNTANARRNVHVFELKSSLWDPSKNNRGVPDPISFTPDQSALNSLLPAEMRRLQRRWVGVVGALTPRKNIELVLESAGRVQNPQLGIVLAGQIDLSIKESVYTKIDQLRQQGIPVIVLDKLLTDGQLDAMLELLHCVVLAHTNEGPSGILGKAVEAGTYVIAAGAHSLRVDCQALAAARWSPLTPDAIAQSIDAGLSTSSIFPRKLRTETIFSERLLPVASQGSHEC